MKYILISVLTLLLSGCGFLSSFKPPAPQEPPPPDNSRAELLLDATIALATKDENVFCTGAVVERTFITAYHCVSDGRAVRGKYLGKWYDVVPYMKYEEVDLALIELVGARPQRSLAVSTWDRIVGQKVAWAGYPLGDPHKHFFLGNISALDNPHAPHYFDVDGQFIPGNSGGPIIDESGGLIGIISATSVWIFGIPQLVPIGHAVKAEYIRELLDKS